MHAEPQIAPPPHAYWIVPGELLGGAYPGTSTSWPTGNHLPALLAIGVSYFVDLTEPHENGTRPYERELEQRAHATGRPVIYRRVAITDFGVPSHEQMEAILGALAQAREAQRLAYVHCFAGIGRTATVAGCHLVQRGLTPADAWRRLRQQRQGTEHEVEPYPATALQAKFVEDWYDARGE